MVVTFTNHQTDSFFMNGPQMSLTAIVRERLSNEGLTQISDFSDFKEDQLSAAFKNMRTSIPGVAAVAQQVAADGTIIVPAVDAVPALLPTLVSAKCALRLKVASIAFHYYESIGRDITPSNMNYTNVLRDFYTEYESVIALSTEMKPSVPVLHKNNTPLKWMESFKDCLFRTYGLRKTPLLYVIRDDVVPPPEEDDPLQAGKAYGSSGTVVDELIARLSHEDPLFKSDNALVYSMLEEATRGTVYSPTVKPHSRRKDGRSAWLSMISSHAGTDKWEQLQKDRSRFLMNTKWNGRNYSLEKFTGMHRNSFVQLQEAATHVNFQLPTEHTRVGYLLDNIVNSDPDLRAAIASVRIDTNGMRANFEDAVAFLLPVDPYSKNRRNNQDNRQANISDTNALKNKSQSKTGVDLRWHTPEEYKTLNKEQRAELYEWQRTKEGKATSAKQRLDSGHKGKLSAKKKLQTKVAALEAQLKVQQSSEPTLDEIKACLASAMTSKNESTTVAPAVQPATDAHAAAAVALKNILKRKRTSFQE